MIKKFIAALLLLPGVASAECGFVRTDSTMTIVVSKKSNKCFTSGAFREAFKADLTAALKVMNGEPPAASAQNRAADRRNAKGEKLWTLQEIVQLASVNEALRAEIRSLKEIADEKVTEGPIAAASSY